jgi:hypothetical protein
VRSDSPETLQPDDLGFEAFRYVAGEMTDSEALAFEERLAGDQAAREAVAQAVEIAQAVTVLGPQAVPAGSPGNRAILRKSRRAAVVAVLAALAACLALAVGLDPFGRSGSDLSREEGFVQSDRPANAARLIEFWTRADDLFPLASEAASLDGLGPQWFDETGILAENGNESEFAWMLAAVSAELPLPDGGASDDPQPQEN